METISATHLFLIIVMTMGGAFASLFFKKASQSEGLIALAFNYRLYIGGVLYLIAALVNIYVLKFVDYTVVLPLTSFTYVWTMIISRWILKEKINAYKIIGVGLILLGAFLVTRM